MNSLNDSINIQKKIEAIKQLRREKLASLRAKENSAAKG